MCLAFQLRSLPDLSHFPFAPFYSPFHTCVTIALMYSPFCFDNIKGLCRYCFEIAKSVNPFKINRKVMDIELTGLISIRQCIDK